MAFNIPRPGRITKHAAQFANAQANSAKAKAAEALGSAGISAPGDMSSPRSVLKGGGAVAKTVINQGKSWAHEKIVAPGTQKAAGMLGQAGIKTAESWSDAGSMVQGVANRGQAWATEQAGHVAGTAKNTVQNGYDHTAKAAQHATAFAEAQARNATTRTRNTTKKAANIALGVMYTINDESNDLAAVLTNPVLIDLGGKILKAVADAVDVWKAEAYFTGIKIMGPTATGVVGCLQGPELEPHILDSPAVSNLPAGQAMIRDAVADAVSECFAIWQAGVAVPALPWYPTFLLCFHPTVPLTPNVPTPLGSCLSVGATKLTLPFEMRQVIMANLPGELQWLEPFATAMASNLANSFSLWLALANVQSVFGSGRVPSCAPPTWAPGPVVNGTILTPGQPLAAAPRMTTMPLPSFG